MTFSFRLQRTDGSPADPPTYRSSVPSWRQGDTIPLNAERTLRVLGIRDDDADRPPVLVVEELPRRRL
jgi:endonuclease YncB( thermonuclease family)